ncbi:lectin like domain-containing protein [Methanofollis aquaemaris]|nr:lectin like domain-containing protein [Methanofollis aquaemaris]
MTIPSRHILTVLVCVGLALLAMPGAAAPLDQSFFLSPNEPAPSPGADDPPTADAVPDFEAASLNQSFILPLDDPGTFPGADGTLTAGAVPGLEAAPLNPAFVRYQEEQEAANGPVLLCAVAPEDRALPPLTGLLPSPVTLVWSDGGVVAATAEPPSEAYFNLADEGRVTAVKDQGKCGSCWTFASLGSLESALLTDGLGEWNLSENNMKNTHGFDWGPCDGGNAFMATAYLARWSGPVNESDDPYLLPNPSPDSPAGLAPVLQVQNVTYLPPRDGPLDNDLIKTTIKEDGGLYAGFLVNYSCFGPNAATYYLPENSTAKLDGGHAVLLVGWDDAYPAANFVETPPGDGAFIAKNSWGTSLGDNGYFYISYYDRSVGRFKNPAREYIGDGGATATVLFTGEPLGTYDHLYQYDPLGSTRSIGISTTMYGANLFTVERYENLHAVSIFTREPDTAYEVRVSSLDGGIPYQTSSAHGTMALPGYHTVPLDTPVPLVPGQNFSVTLKLTAPTDTHPLAVEMPIEDYSSNATAHTGESFVSIDGREWADLTDFFPDTNLCIKAFTRDPLSVPGDYATIQAAVEAALPGQMVFIEDGTYAENVVIDKPLALVGSRDAVIDGGAGTALTLTGSTVTLRGFSITGGDDGVLVAGNDTTLVDLHLIGCGGDGIEIDGASKTFIADTEVLDGMHDGIKVNNASNVFVFGCALTGNGGNGMSVDDASSVIAYRCNLTGNDDDGMRTNTAVGVMVLQCTLAGNGDDGIWAIDTADLSVYNSNVSVNHDSGVEVSRSNRTVFVDVNAAANGESGIDLSSADAFMVTRCTATGNGESGIALYDVKNGGLSQNTMAGHKWNINFAPSDGAEDTVVIDETNTVDGKPVYVWNDRYDEAVPTDAGMVYLMGCRNVTAADLTLSGNFMGLYVYNSTDITVRNVLASGNNAGAYCRYVDNLSVDASAMEANGFAGFVSQNCTALEVTGSRIADNIVGAIVVADDPADTLFWRNSFVNNSAGHFAAMGGQVTLNTAAPLMYRYNGTYYTHALGNYWDDYAGNDTDGDGVGETPYTARNAFTPMSVNDTCPLVAPADRYVPGFPDNDGGDDWGGIGVGGDLNAGATTSMQFRGSAVTEITLTAAKRIDGVMVTVAPVDEGPDGLDSAVYQYLTANLTYVTDDAIAEANFTFDVPAAWLNEHGLAPDEVALWRYHNETWVALPTEIVREESGRIVYRATSPGFSYFAVAAGRAIEPAVTVPSAESVDLNATAANATAEKPVVSETPLPTASTAATTPAPTAPAQSPLPWWLAVLAAGGTISFTRRR